MNEKQLKEIFGNLNIWKKGDQRAPHKPLLVLYALANLKNGKTGLLKYVEVREPLKQLLIDFGPYRKSYTPEEPFVRLTQDGIWKLNKERNQVEVSNRWLIDHQIAGGFNDHVTSLLVNNNRMIKEIAEIVLDAHFPQTLHEDILLAVGLDICDDNDYIIKSVRKRDSKFRDRILHAYEYKCAVCGFNVRLGNQLIGVEAAHIKWHQAGGPDVESNGIALCSMHHKLYDRGVFTIVPSKRIIVSKKARGNMGFDEWLMRYHGKMISNPVEKSYYPEVNFIEWNVREVFQGDGRW